jgi:hypothetical protein
MAVKNIYTAHFHFQIITRRVSHKSLITGFIYFHDVIKAFLKYEIINLYLQRRSFIHANEVTKEVLCPTH